MSGAVISSNKSLKVEQLANDLQGNNVYRTIVQTQTNQYAEIHGFLITAGGGVSFVLFNVAQGFGNAFWASVIPSGAGLVYISTNAGATLGNKMTTLSAQPANGVDAAMSRPFIIPPNCALAFQGTITSNVKVVGTFFTNSP